jgi:D-ornithine 4,5-aminomutase subunit alpha
MNDDRMVKFEQVRGRLREMIDDQLKDRFWALCDKAVEPMVDLARTHTSPSIERAVLLRMGIDSISSHGIVDRIHEAGLLGKGAGHVVLKVSQRTGRNVKAAAAAILEDKAVLEGLF